jgi:hypothetical protein
MIMLDIKQKLQDGNPFVITGNERLEDGTYQFFKGCYPTTATTFFLRKQSLLARWVNQPDPFLAPAQLHSVTEYEITVWVERGDILLIPSNQIKFY